MNVRERRLLPPPISLVLLPLLSSFSSAFSPLFFYQQTGHTTCSRLMSQILPREEWDFDQSLSPFLVPRLSPSSPRMPSLFCLFSACRSRTDTAEHLRGQTAGNRVFYCTPSYNAVSFVLCDDAFLRDLFPFCYF